jgi:endo-1,4-beta-mannosidase
MACPQKKLDGSHKSPAASPRRRAPLPSRVLTPPSLPAAAPRPSRQLILAFTSNWTPTGGLPEYVKWAGLANQSEFYTSPVARGMYRDFVAQVLNRRNSINGRLYRDDPTVMAW